MSHQEIKRLADSANQFKNNIKDYAEFTAFLKKHAPQAFSRLVYLPETAAKLGLPQQSSLVEDKAACHVVRFNKCLDRAMSTPSLTIVWLDIDNADVVAHFNCSDFADLRAYLASHLEALSIPTVVLATPSGKAKVGIPVRISNGEETTSLSLAEQSIVLKAIAEAAELTELLPFVDACWAGMSMLCLTSTMGLTGIYNTTKPPVDVKKQLADYRYEQVKPLKFKVDLTQKTLVQLPELTKFETAILEVIAAFQITSPDETLELSQASLAKTISTSATTVSMTLKSLQAKGLITKTKAGNFYRGASSYLLSWGLIKAFQRSLETSGLINTRIQQINNSTGLKLKLVGIQQVTNNPESELTRALGWLNNKYPLANGSRFAHAPHWSGTLAKLGYSVEETAEIMQENAEGYLNLAEASNWIRCLRNKDKHNR
jgi:DNA-binding Lrp family transcriptional regulator